MLLLWAIGILGIAVVAGGWLGAQVLMLEEPQTIGVNWRGLAHGATALVGFVVLVLALRFGVPTARAVRMGAGGFGIFSGALVAGAAVAGLTMLMFQIRRRPIPLALIAGHGMLGVTGYTLLVTYLTMLY